MKEATGELSTTVIVIIAAVLLIGIVRTVVMPLVERYINEEFDDMSNAYIEIVREDINI